jgi:general secretion pathway protein J
MFSSVRGFTLIELAIAITLVGLITAVLYGAFYLGNRAVEKAQAGADEIHGLRAELELLSGYLRSAYPYRCSPQQADVSFTGDETNLSFVSSLSAGLGGRGMAKITVAFSSEVGEVVLEEALPAYLACGREGSGHRNRLILDKNLSDFRIAYLDPQSTDEERWVETWDGKERRALPRAVRFSSLGTDEREVRWTFPIMTRVLAP